MRTVFVSSLLLVTAITASGTAADPAGQPAPQPGPMEYLEVTDKLDVTAAAKEHLERRRQEFAHRLQQEGKREQAQSLLERQLRQLDLFRLRLQELQAQPGGNQSEREAAQQPEREHNGETS